MKPSEQTFWIIRIGLSYAIMTVLSIIWKLLEYLLDDRVINQKSDTVIGALISVAIAYYLTKDWRVKR